MSAPYSVRTTYTSCDDCSFFLLADRHRLHAACGLLAWACAGSRHAPPRATRTFYRCRTHVVYAMADARPCVERSRSAGFRRGWKSRWTAPPAPRVLASFGAARARTAVPVAVRALAVSVSRGHARLSAIKIQQNRSRKASSGMRAHLVSVVRSRTAACAHPWTRRWPRRPAALERYPRPWCH